MLTRTATRISASSSLVLVVIVLLVLSALPAQVAATPASGQTHRLRAQNVDWMSAEQASALNLSFPVLVPTWIPAPFSGSPAISGSGGYYSLYWVNQGGAPTFLQVTGEVGGSLPAGSPADLNVELSVNASVQGYEAIHDVTSIYDNVWWVAGGVLYTVSSNNMTGTDSLSLANSLIVLQPPVAPEPDPPTPTVEPEPVVEEPSVPEEQEPDSVDTDTDTDDTGDTSDLTEETGESGVESSTDTVVDTSESTTGTGGTTDTSDTDTSTDSTVPTATAEADAEETDSENVTGTSGQVPISDGTAGPGLPTVGDGTGGARQVLIP